MASAVSHLTISAIADSLNIEIPDNGVMTMLEQEAEKFIKQILNEANALYQATRAYKLTTDHIDMVLEMNNCKPLLGYKTSIPSYSPQPVFVESADQFNAREVQQNLEEESEIPVPEKTASTPHTLHWTLVEGTYIGKRSQNRDRRPVTKSKVIERSVSTPLGNIQSDSFRVSPYSLTDAERGENSFADDLLSDELQKFFVNTINRLRYDTVNSLDRTLDEITYEDKMQPLIPYFIQWAFGKMTLGLQNSHEMLTVLKLIHAIAVDKSVNVPLYAHSLLKIAFTGLLSISLSEDGDDREVRETAAHLLKVICDRSKTDFPQIREVTFNSLTSALFSGTNSLAAHYGALLGIRDLGPLFFEAFMPHIRFYVSCIAKELNVKTNHVHEFWCNEILQCLKEMLGSYIDGCGSDDNKDTCLQLIDVIDRVDYE